MTTVRSFRSTVLSCAAQWLMVGLQLADLLRGVENSSMRHVKIIMLICFTIGGIFSIVQLWTVPREESPSVGTPPAT